MATSRLGTGIRQENKDVGSHGTRWSRAKAQAQVTPEDRYVLLLGAPAPSLPFLHLLHASISRAPLHLSPFFHTLNSKQKKPDSRQNTTHTTSTRVTNSTIGWILTTRDFSKKQSIVIYHSDKITHQFFCIKNHTYSYLTLLDNIIYTLYQFLWYCLY